MIVAGKTKLASLSFVVPASGKQDRIAEVVKEEAEGVEAQGQEKVKLTVSAHNAAGAATARKTAVLKAPKQ